MKLFKEVTESQAWLSLETKVKKNDIALTQHDQHELQEKVDQSVETQNTIIESITRIKQIEKQQTDNILVDLANQLNSMKMREIQDAKQKKSKKRVSTLRSSIKLTKDEKDAMVANSLQLDATIRKALNES